MDETSYLLIDLVILFLSVTFVALIARAERRRGDELERRVDQLEVAIGSMLEPKEDRNGKHELKGPKPKRTMWD